MQVSMAIDWHFVSHEATKAGFAALVSALTLALGWVVGQQLTAKWALRQKRRELELSSANELHNLYGEFFAVWKLWNCYKYDPRVAAATKDIRWLLLQRAALVEAGVEALLVKVASERTLADEQRHNLGLLRQAFQQLRESIRDDKPLDWGNSDHRGYAEFKRLSCLFSIMLASDHSYKNPKAENAIGALKKITSNSFEQEWKGICDARQSDQIRTN